MSAERIASVVAAGVGSAAGFYVITESGMVGTLAGASVAAMVYVGTWQLLTPRVQRSANYVERTVRRRRVASGAAADEGETVADPVPPPEGSVPETGAVEAAGSRYGIFRPSRGRQRLFGWWVPVLLGFFALVFSGYAVFAGEPLEQVIVREVVVEKPIVEERVVVERETVTVTVPVYVEGESSGPDRGSSTATTPTTSASPSTSATTEPSTTNTTEAASGSSTTSVPPTTATTDTSAAE